MSCLPTLVGTADRLFVYNTSFKQHADEETVV